MKRIAIISALLLSTLTCWAQTDFIVYSGPGTIMLKDSSVVEGTVSYALTSPTMVRLVKEGKDDKYKAENVISFQVDGKAFYSLLTKDAISLKGIKNYVFAYITNPDQKKVRVYKYEQQSNIIVGGQASVEKTLYVQFPNVEDAIPLSDMRICPSKKMVKFVEDCPTLVEKLNSKDKKYTYGMISSDTQKLEVIFQMAIDYDQCQ